MDAVQRWRVVCRDWSKYNLIRSGFCPRQCHHQNANRKLHNISQGHAVDVHTKTAYALGVFSMGGFEKITEINSQHPDYVMFALAGYNGDMTGNSAVLKARNAEFKRADGKPYVWSENIVPFRMYVGIKGKCEDGSDCDDFLARNGLRYGQIYGFAIDMTASGPSSGLWRDAFHLDPKKAMNGAKVDGKWIAQPWRWDGKVKNFQYDGSWDFQNDPAPGYKWWNSNGYDSGGFKTEHCSPVSSEKLHVRAHYH